MSTLVTAGQELIGIATLCGASLESRECVEEVPAGVCAHRRARSSWSDWSRPRQPGLASWGLVWSCVASARIPGAPLSIELTLAVFDPRHHGRLAPRSSVPSRPAIGWVCTPPGMPLVARERRLEKRRFVGGRSSSRRNCASTGGHTSTLVRRLTGVVCRSANPGSLRICSPAERLRFAPCRRYQPPSLRLRSCGRRGAGNPKLSRLIAYLSGSRVVEPLPSQASVGPSVGVWDPAALRTGARAYFGPRPSGWLRGRRQDVDRGKPALSASLWSDPRSLWWSARCRVSGGNGLEGVPAGVSQASSPRATTSRSRQPPPQARVEPADDSRAPIHLANPPLRMTIRPLL